MLTRFKARKVEASKKGSLNKRLEARGWRCRARAHKLVKVRWPGLPAGPAGKDPLQMSEKEQVDEREVRRLERERRRTAEIPVRHMRGQHMKTWTRGGPWKLHTV